MQDDSLDGVRQILCQEIGDEDNIEGDDDITEEVEPLRMPRNPVLPSAAEIEEHRKTHIPFRCWCIECLMGRGLGEQRGAHAGRSHSIPRVGVDFWYITSGTIKRRDELEYPVDDEGDAKLNEARKRGDLVKCLIIRCHETKCVFAHVIPVKGRDEDSYVDKCAAATRRRFILDSGASADLVGEEGLDEDERRNVTKAADILNISTANGPTASTDEVELDVPNFGIRAKTRILDDCPDVLSMGIRCAEQGFGFYWDPFSYEPRLVRPDGHTIRCSYEKGGYRWCLLFLTTTLKRKLALPIA